MTREEAIFILKRDNPNNIAVRLGFESLYDQREEAFLMAIKALEQTKWIPVGEKMPPIAQRVLVSATNGEVFIARYYSFDKWTFEPTGISYAYKKDSIVAWMSLPEGYTESEDKE